MLHVLVPLSLNSETPHCLTIKMFTVMKYTKKVVKPVIMLRIPLNYIAMGLYCHGLILYIFLHYKTHRRMTPPTLLGDYSAARERYRKQAADPPPPPPLTKKKLWSGFVNSLTGNSGLRGEGMVLQLLGWVVLQRIYRFVDSSERIFRVEMIQWFWNCIIHC